MIHSIKETEYHPLSPTFSPFVQQLMKKLLNKSPQERPDAGTILRMKEIDHFKTKIFA
jgi:hypothetical protein